MIINKNKFKELESRVLSLEQAVSELSSIIKYDNSSKECSTPSYKEVIDEWLSGKSN